MLRRVRILALPLLVGAAGCLAPESGNLLVPSNSFPKGQPRQPVPQVSVPPATQEAATRVGLVGQKVLAANEQIGFRPMFRTVGAPDVALLHKGTSEVIITEGLVKRCETEGQLAAVLCHELGKMVSEREALAGPSARVSEIEPPAQMRIGNDGGAFGPPDLTYLAEQAPYDRSRRKASEPPPPPPDPAAVAQSLMMKAGYGAADLKAAEPLLIEAAKDSAWHRLSNSPTPQNWTRPNR